MQNTVQMYLCVCVAPDNVNPGQKRVIPYTHNVYIYSHQQITASRYQSLTNFIQAIAHVLNVSFKNYVAASPVQVSGLSTKN